MSDALTVGGRWAVDLRDREVAVAGTRPLDPLLVADLTDAGAVLRRYPAVTAADLARAWLVVWAGGGPRTREQVRALADEQRILFVDAAAAEPDATTAPDPARPGRVVLVGGGPGSPGLLTLRGWQALNEADAVVVDRLAPVGLLAGLDARVEIVDVGKQPLHHPVPQQQIEQILLDRARAGQTVVRLKGGDPYLLGRGGEEVLACRAAGIDVEVIPGVSSALAGPAAAGIPLTHRGVSRAVAIVSGHEPPDYPSLAALDGTLIILMGMGRLHELTAGLIAAGMPADTPAAAVHRAWTDRQAVVLAGLGTIASRCATAGVGSPAVVVIGQVARGLDELGRLEQGGGMDAGAASEQE